MPYTSTPGETPGENGSPAFGNTDAGLTAYQQAQGATGTGAFGAGMAPNQQLAAEGYQQYVGTAAPTTPTGATSIDTSGAAPFSAAQQALLAQLGSQAQGTGGPTVADQQLQAGLAQSIAAQKAGTAGARGPSAGLQAKAIQAGTANTQAGMSGTAAAQRAAEQKSAQGELGSLATTGAAQQYQLAGAQTEAQQYGASLGNAQWQFTNNLAAGQQGQENAAISSAAGAGAAGQNQAAMALINPMQAGASGIGGAIGQFAGGGGSSDVAPAAEDAAAADGAIVAGPSDDGTDGDTDANGQSPSIGTGGDPVEGTTTNVAGTSGDGLGTASKALSIVNSIMAIAAAAKGGTMDLGAPGKGAQGPSAPKVLPGQPGGHIIRIGEAGPEAVVPLTEPRKSQFFAALKEHLESAKKGGSAEEPQGKGIAHALALAGHGLESRMDGVEKMLAAITKRKARKAAAT